MKYEDGQMREGEMVYPVLSAIVISRNDEATIEKTIRSIVTQNVNAPVEVIVVNSGTDRTANVVRERFPGVRVIKLEKPALPGEARNAGVLAARGEYVSFPGSHTELPPGSLAARIQAHRLGYAMITGSILNGTRTSSGWASYFLDHSDALPSRPSGELSKPPMHCSYNRKILLGSGLFPEDMRAGEDTVVNTRLWREGHRAYRANQVTLIHRSPCRNPWLLSKHHFIRGRAWGRIISERGYSCSLLIYYLPQRLRRTKLNVAKWGGEFTEEYRRVRTLCALGATSAWLGTCYEYAIRLFSRAFRANESRHDRRSVS